MATKRPKDSIQPTDDEIMITQQLDDKHRSAFGLGYEFCRRGKPKSCNPFGEGSWRAAEFDAGWEKKAETGPK